MEEGGDSGSGTEGEDDPALMAACRYGHLVMVRTLLALGAKPNVTDKSGDTALMHVCQYEQDDDDGHQTADGFSESGSFVQDS